MKPNILWIFSDQHRAHALGCYGDPNIETPNLDRLAAEGIRFTNAYSNCPLCSPFRASLYTGKYAHHHGVRSLDIPFMRPQYTLQEHLRRHGYYTAHMGKWHLAGGAAPDAYVSEYFRPGWDLWRGWENMNRPFDTYYTDAVDRNRRVPLGVFQTDGITDFTVNWLGQYHGDKPWFFVMSIEAPHPPNQAPEEYMAIFRHRQIIHRPNFAHEHAQADRFQNELRGYYAQIRNLDDNVGRVLDALTAKGELDNTIVCYFSDHGDFMGSHGLRGKSRAEDESSNIPLIVRYPEKIAAGSVSDALISGIDLMPSVLGLAEVPVPDTCDGIDLGRVFVDHGQSGRDEILLQFYSAFFSESPDVDLAFRGLVTGEWTYAYYFMQQRHVLYNRIEDPYQMTDLAADPHNRALCADWYRRLLARMAKEDDTAILEYFR